MATRGLPMQRSTSDPNVLFRTLLTKVASHLLPHDAEQLAFINGLPKTDIPRRPLDVLSELEKRGVYSRDNIDPLINLLTDITRVDVINSCGVNEYKEHMENMRGKKMSNPAVGHVEPSNGFGTGHNNSSMNTMLNQPANQPSFEQPLFDCPLYNQDPTLECSGDDYVTMTSQLPHLRETITSPNQSDLTSIVTTMTTEDRRKVLKELAADPGSMEYMRELIVDDQSGSPSQQHPTDTPTSKLRFTGEDTPTHTHSQPETEIRQLELESLPPSSASLSAPLHASISISTQTDLEPRSQPEALLPTNEVSTSSLLSRGTYSSSGIASDLSPLEGRGMLSQQVSTNSEQDEGTPHMGNNSTVGDNQGVSPSRNALSDQAISVDRENGSGVASNGTSGELHHFDEKLCLEKPVKWRLKRNDICAPIYKHSRKFFEKDVKLKTSSNSSKCRDIKVTLQLSPAGLGKDTDSFMTMTVRVDVGKKCGQLLDMARLHLRITTIIEEGDKGGDEPFKSVKTAAERLQDFTIHDFLPHSLIKDSHAKHIEFCVEAYLTHGHPAANEIDVDSIDYPEESENETQ